MCVFCDDDLHNTSANTRLIDEFEIVCSRWAEYAHLLWLTTYWWLVIIFLFFTYLHLFNTVLKNGFWASWINNRIDLQLIELVRTLSIMKYNMIKNGLRKGIYFGLKLIYMHVLSASWIKYTSFCLYFVTERVSNW